MQPLSSGEWQAHSSLPEDRFVELFAQVFGLDKVLNIRKTVQILFATPFPAP